MIMNLYSVNDIVAGEFGPLWQAKNDQIAIRQYHTILKDVKDFREDYQLMRMGTYDTEHGTIDYCPVEINLEVQLSDMRTETFEERAI